MLCAIACACWVVALFWHNVLEMLWGGGEAPPLATSEAVRRRLFGSRLIHRGSSALVRHRN